MRVPSEFMATEGMSPPLRVVKVVPPLVLTNIDPPKVTRATTVPSSDTVEADQPTVEIGAVLYGVKVRPRSLLT